ncbi:putative autotransporter adhesin-like protein [Winogradskyella wandonensis]|uniref:Putative autotransporter adhesin-like protein n=1 Tax=Winogradskyella wandonensis TaxID=1442586 RepID=A0A4R1KQX5_9FLAO|nr:head GIN domain-containing protein [Winogradskyella wandonensis]TCK67465.1 putative autotransporter adhesin-like protein [Winogradskyella wandonensis]
MKKIIYIYCCFILFACDSENASDCFQTAGTLVQEEFTVDNFSRVLVNRDIELIIKEGPQQVIVETGENLLNDIEVEVVGNQLVLTDNNTCNFVRDYGITKVYVSSPNLTEIRCSTQFEIKSDGILTYDNLALISEDFSLPDSFPIGDYRLQLDVENLQITSNNLSLFYLSGTAENVNINFANGNGRFEGENLVAENISVFHRGTNDILVNPQQSLTGRILSTGNVISYNLPPIVDVEEVFNGRLIFN